MLKFFVPVLILVVVAGIWLGLGLPIIGGPELLRSDSEEFFADFLANPDRYCDLLDPSCLAAVETVAAIGRPTPIPDDPRARDVVFQDQTLQPLLTGQEGVDYWIQIDTYDRLIHGSEGAAMTIVFAEPTSFEGSVLRGTDPCSGQRNDGYLAPDNPCLDEEREFETIDVSFKDIRVLYGGINPELGFVLNLFTMDLSQHSLDLAIEQIETATAQLQPEATTSPD